MIATARFTKPVHQALLAVTHDAHEALHHHPTLSRLVSKSLTSTEYQQILLAYQSFFEGAEKQRHDLLAWNQFSLTGQLHCLGQDIRELHHFHPSGPDKLTCDSLSDSPVVIPCTTCSSSHKAAVFPWMKCQLSSLGVLYVLHGSAFGAKVISRCLRQSLPHLNHHFFSHGINRQIWKRLLDSFSELIEKEDDFERLQHSVRLTYHRFGEWVML